MKAILHAADISNPLRPWQGALAAAERVHAEFAQQAAQQRLQQLPVAPHMEASDPAVWARMEVEFIDYVVGPLWSRLSQVGCMGPRATAWFLTRDYSQLHASRLVVHPIRWFQVWL